MTIINTFKLWWGMRKYFKRPKACVKLVKINKPAFKIVIRGLRWKDKWNSPRHEEDPHIGIFFFKRCLFISFGWYDGKEKDYSMDYWEQLLWTKYYNGKNLRRAYLKWEWTNYSTKESTWNNEFLTEHGKDKIPTPWEYSIIKKLEKMGRETTN